MSPVRFPIVPFESFFDIILPAPTKALGSIQPLKEMNTRNISLGVKAAGLRAELSTFMCRLPRNMGASNSWISKGLSKSLHRLLYLSSVPLKCAVNSS